MVVTGGMEARTRPNGWPQFAQEYSSDSLCPSCFVTFTLLFLLHFSHSTVNVSALYGCLALCGFDIGFLLLVETICIFSNFKTSTLACIAPIVSDAACTGAARQLGR